MTRLTSGCAIAALTIQFFGWTTLSAGAWRAWLAAHLAALRAGKITPAQIP